MEASLLPFANRVSLGTHSIAASKLAVMSLPQESDATKSDYCWQKLHQAVSCHLDHKATLVVLAQLVLGVSGNLRSAHCSVLPILAGFGILTNQELRLLKHSM